MSVEVEREPIAIIGLGCRFPGGVGNPRAFWELLVNGGNGVCTVPPDRWNLDAFYDDAPGRLNRINNRYGGFLNGVDLFDAGFFGISDREAKSMDPQQRLLLEVSWEAVEDSGLLPSRLSGKNVGVFVGIAAHDYSDLQQRSTTADVYTNTGNASSIAASRIAYFFNWKGPCFSVDTACSSSLVALHLACQSLTKHECSLALVGGVSLLLNPGISIGFSRASMLSPDGCCRAFDDRANGYVRSEGVGAVVLKPLSRAQKDADEIYALIKGTGTNQDGKTNGLTLPNQESQAGLLRDVCRRAGVSPEEITYIEAHGTGTPIGDPIELNAIGDAVGKHRVGAPLVVGSVKSNLGHLESASGIAGLIKLALCIRNKAIPPTIHFRYPNSNVAFGKLNLRVATEVEDWVSDSGRLVGGVNSFGFGGSNAHAILESVPRDQASRVKAPAEEEVLRPIPITARSEEALRAYVGRLRTFLEDQTIAHDCSLRDVGYNLSLKREHHNVRMVVLGRTLRGLAADLDAFLKGDGPETICTPCACSSGPRKTVFVFSGQGPQWWAMARQLMDDVPLVRGIVKQCDAILSQHVDWSLWDELHATEEESRISRRTDFAQPAIFTVQIALVALWESFGIAPDAVVGHSAGEITAAYAAGIFTLEEALTILVHKSRLQYRTRGQGKMMAVGLPAEEVEAAIREYDRVYLAGINSHDATMLSGDEDQLKRISEVFEQRAVFHKLLRLDHGFHSHYMEPVKQELIDSLSHITGHAGRIPIYSTVTGRLKEGESFDATHWWLNVREPVLFENAICNILRQEQEQEFVFVEISNHPVLSGYISQCLARSNKKGHVVCSIKRKEDEHQTILKSLGQLFCLGYPINWTAFYPDGKQYRLPTYAWDHESFWSEPRESRRYRLKNCKHPYLDDDIGFAYPTWQMDFNAQSFPYLKDHRVQGNTVYPGAGYVEMALAVYAQNVADEPCELEHVRFHKTFFVPSSDVASFQIAHFVKSSEFRIFSCERSSEEEAVLHCNGYISSLRQDPRSFEEEIETLKAAFFKEAKYAAIYEDFADIGLEYGECFRGIQSLWRRPGEALAEIRIPEIPGAQRGRYRFHPCYLDSCFQVLFGAASLDEYQDHLPTYLPARIDRIRYFGPPGDVVWVHASVTKCTAQRIEGNILVYDNSGTLLLEINGFSCEAVNGAIAGDSRPYGDWFYRFEWIEEQLRVDGSEASNCLVLKDKTGIGDALVSQLSRENGGAFAVAMGEAFEQTDEHTLTVNPSEASHWESVANIICSEAQVPMDNVALLWGLDAPPSHQTTSENLRKFQTTVAGGLIHLLRTLSDQRPEDAPRVWIITRGAEKVLQSDHLDSIAQSFLWGLGRVIANEMPSCHCTLIDIDPVDSRACVPLVLAELAANHQEVEISFRAKKRFVHRFVPIPSDDVIPAVEQQEIRVRSRPFRLQRSTPGTLDGLSLCEVEESPLGPSEVRIQVRAAGLNFRDVMKAIGIYPTEDELDSQLGDECSGIVVAAGKNVKGIHEGDAVIAAAPGCLGSYVVAPAGYVLRKPENMTFEEAAGIPVAFLTAYYSVVRLAKLKKGETILIHAGSGGVGQAAIQLARRRGGRILATAGTPQKRDFLKGLGIEHVMDSRSLDFANEVLQVTRGEGVDVVLNSIAGQAISKSLRILKPYGRFLEIGKVDIFQDSKIGLWPFRKNISFFAIDLADIFRNRRGLLRHLLRQVHGLFLQGRLDPLPHKAFLISEYTNAFRYLAQAKHIGKVVLSLPDGNKAPVTMLPQKPRVATSDATYLVTGGYSGFGFEVAKWLARNGAQHLVLLGRTGKAPRDVSRQIEGLRANGIDIEVAAGDVARPDVVKNVVERIRTSMPPLRGIVHAAMVLDDDSAVRLTEDRFEKVMAPKVLGAWNLHLATLEEQLDFFVLCSSAAGLMGNPGQANYAAANSFLDMLSHYRRSLGLPGLAVDWGMFSKIGYVSRHKDIGQLLQRQGLKGIHSEQALEILGHLLVSDIPQIGVIRVDWKKLAGSSLPFVCSPVFSSILESVADWNHARRGAFASEILSMKEDKRLDAVAERLRREIAEVLSMSEQRLDSNKSLNSLGVDSLMALDLSNKIKNELGIELTMMDIVQGPSIRELSGVILNKITGSRQTAISDLEGPAEVRPSTDREAEHPGPRGDALALPISPEPRDASPHPSDINEPFPLSPLQKAYWVGRSSMFPLCNVGCHAYLESDVRGLDLPKLQWVVNKLIERHDMLRAVILPDGLQQILKSVPHYEIDKQDVGHLPDDEKRQRLQDIRERWSHRKCDPQKWPLCELAATQIDPDTTRVHFSFDLLIGDLTSLQILLYEMTILYNMPDCVLPKHCVSFRDHILAQEQVKSLPVYRAAKAYWLERLDELPTGPELPLQCDPAAISQPRFSRRSLTVDRSRWKRLKSKASSIGVTPSSLVLAAYAEVLSFFSKSPHFCITMTLSDRISLRSENTVRGDYSSIIGDFSSTLIVEINNTYEESFEERIRRHHHQLWQDLRFRQFNGVEVLRELARTHRLDVMPTIPVVFTCHIGQARPLLDDGINPILKELTFSVSQTPQVWIDHQALEVEGELMCSWDAVDELFPPGLLDEMFESYSRLLLTLSDVSIPPRGQGRSEMAVKL